MKERFKLSEEDLEAYFEATQELPCILLYGHEPPSRQSRVNNMWRIFGTKYGFIWDSVEAADGYDREYFMATPTRTEGRM